jgi:hypothetical protein
VIGSPCGRAPEFTRQFASGSEMRVELAGKAPGDTSFRLREGTTRRAGPLRRGVGDLDADADGFDFLTFSNCYNGSNRPPRCP